MTGWGGRLRTTFAELPSSRRMLALMTMKEIAGNEC
jgi:hypothetical protein